MATADHIIVHDQGWQEPARTEAWAYERCKEHLSSSPFVQLVFFPWATLIDLERRRFTKEAEALKSRIAQFPPRSTLIRATVCQHIWAEDLIDVFKALGVTDLFWSHATRSVTEIDGIRIHPFPLYPVRCFDWPGTLENPSIDRRYLYSFVGAYDPNLYLSPARQWVFDLPERDDAIVTQRLEWHFEQETYREQIKGEARDQIAQEHLSAQKHEYVRILRDSVFCLCPSGSGPNSIRIWEALGHGVIPVVIADDLRLPGDASDWSDAVLRIEESQDAVARLPGLLAELAETPEEIIRRLEAVQTVWARYVENGPENLIGDIHRLDYLSNSIQNDT